MFNHFPYRNKFIVILPDSIISNESSLYLKTLKIAGIFRTLSIFKVSELIFYNHRMNQKEHRLITDLIDAISCAPQIRKYIKKKDALKFIGAVPPIKSPNQVGVKIDNDKIIKEVYIIQNKKKNKDVIVDFDLNIRLKYFNSEEKEKNSSYSIIPVSITRKKIQPFELKSKYFWKVNFKKKFEDLPNLLKQFEKLRSKLIIAATRYGNIINNLIQKPEFVEKIRKSQKLILIFGPLKGSFKEYLKSRKMSSKIDYFINFIKDQGTLSVRLEDALFSSLAILNALI